MNITKERMQKELRGKSDLYIDYPRQGSGNSNDGNTDGDNRRFFRDPRLASEITGVDLRLIVRFGIILQTVACDIKIDSAKFDKFAKDTAKLYMELYGWYYMPATVQNSLSWCKNN